MNHLLIKYLLTLQRDELGADFAHKKHGRRVNYYFCFS